MAESVISKGTRFVYGTWTHTVTSYEAGNSVITVSPNTIHSGAKYIIPTSALMFGTKIVPLFYDQTNIVSFNMLEGNVSMAYIAIIE
jgi:hypothetical protein